MTHYLSPCSRPVAAHPRKFLSAGSSGYLLQDPAVVGAGLSAGSSAHLAQDPAIIVAGPGVDARVVGPGTADAEAHHANRHPLVVRPLLEEERPS